MSTVNGGIADDIRLESDESGFELHIDSSEGTFVFNVHGLAPTELCKMLGSIAHEIDMWWAEGIQAAHGARGRDARSSRRRVTGL